MHRGLTICRSHTRQIPKIIALFEKMNAEAAEVPDGSPDRTYTLETIMEECSRLLTGFAITDSCNH